MIAIVDYGMGNLRSVENALRRLGAEFCVTADAGVIRAADRVLLPGVGNAAEAMEPARADLVWRHTPSAPPRVGHMRRHAGDVPPYREGDADCIGLFDARVRRFVAAEDVRCRMRGMDGGVCIFLHPILNSGHHLQREWRMARSSTLSKERCN